MRLSTLITDDRPASMADRLYQGDYPMRRRRIVTAAKLNDPVAAYVEVRRLLPDLPTDRVVCWQCRQPLVSCGPNRNGRHRSGGAAHWTAGHVVDGDRLAPLAPECSPCNYSRGAAHGNRLRDPRSNRTSREW